MTTLQVLLHVTAQRDYELHSLDFSTAFLQGSLHEEIWLRRPPGFTGSFPAGTQWSLWRPVYDLRQAPREWHDTLRTTLAALGFAPSTADPLLFLRTDTSLPPFYVLVYVDDLVFAIANTEALTLVKSELPKRHTCTDLGELRSYLGLQITRDRAQRTITLTRPHMVFSASASSSPRHSPLLCLPAHLRTSPLLARYVAPGRHRKQRGQLHLAYVATRANTADIFTKALPPGDHQRFSTMLGLLALVFLTGLVTTCSPHFAYGVRRAWGSCLEDGVQLSSLVTQTLLGLTTWLRSGRHRATPSALVTGSVSWRSTRSSSILKSCCEAEIYAGAMAAHELRCLTYLLTDLGERPRSSPILYVDNKAMIALCQEHRLEHRTKHIALRYFLARDLQQRGKLRLAYVATRANTADIFIKSLQSGDHQRFCTMLGLRLAPAAPSRQRAAPHSSEFPPTEAPLQTLHMDVKGDVPEVLIDWIRAARLQLRESFGSDFPVLRLHSNRGGEFSSTRLGAFCRAQGIRQTFTLPASPQQNGITERRIGMVMDVALRSASAQPSAPGLLARDLPTLGWTGKVGDASAFRVWGSRAFVRDLSADKLSPRGVPCVFLGFPPDAPGWQFYHPTSRRVLSSQDVTFDESVPYYRLFPYRTAPLPPPPLFLAPGPPPVDFLPPQGPTPSGVSQVDVVEPVEVGVDSGAARGAEPVGAGSGGAESGGAELGGAESWGAEPGGAEPGGAEPGGVESGGAEPGGADPGGAESARVASRSASSRRELLSPQELREWFARRWSRAAGAGGPPVAPGPGGARTGGTGAVGTGGAAAAAGVGPAVASGATGAGAAGGVGAGVVPAGGTAGAAGGTGAAGPAGVGAVGAGGTAGTSAATGGTRAVPIGTGGPARPRPYFVPLLEPVLGLPPSPGPAPPLECPQPVQSSSPLQPVSPLPAPSPYASPTGGLAERREPASRPASPVRTTRTSRCAPRPRPPAVPGTHQMTLRPSFAPLRVPLPSPPESSLPVLADPASDSLRAASPTVACLLSTVVTDPSFESTAASALVAELVDFAARCRLDYAASLVAESAPVCPPSVGGECALSTDVLEDRQEEFQCFAAALPHLVSTLIAPKGDPDAPDIPTPRSYIEAIEGPYSSQWQSAMDAEMASWKSTGTYVDEVPPPGPNIVSGMWIFRVKRPPGSPPVFKACYVARGFSQRQGFDYFQTFSPTPKMTTLWVLLHVAAQRDYELHSLDFSTAFLQGSLHEEIWLRRPPGFTGSFPPGTQWSLRRPVYGLRQAPREWHDTLTTTLAALGFAPSTADPSLFLRTDTSLPPFYILVYVDDLVFATADTAGLAHVKSELQKRHTCTDLGELRSYLGLQITRDRAQRTITLTQSHMVQQVLQRFDFTGPRSRNHFYSRHNRSLRCIRSTSTGATMSSARSFIASSYTKQDTRSDTRAVFRSYRNTFSLGSGSVSWRSTRSSSVLGSSCEAEIYAGAMAAQELRWLTYLLADLGEPPRSPPVLYVDNKAMLALCREHRLEHRTKHIDLRYFLAREL
ncbi:unnamed protein product [Closterium sp. NIES-53]